MSIQALEVVGVIFAGLKSLLGNGAVAVVWQAARSVVQWLFFLRVCSCIRLFFPACTYIILLFHTSRSYIRLFFLHVQLVYSYFTFLY